MSWIEKLYKTYECNKNLETVEKIPLLPLYHAEQKAHLRVVLDKNGNFLRASTIAKEDSQTIIPATEQSAGRSGAKIAPHPLFDTLQYVAGDYLDWGGNPDKAKDQSGFKDYMKQLQEWVSWSQSPKLEAVYTYLSRKSLIKDLVYNKVLFADTNHKLMKKWQGVGEKPPIFKSMDQHQSKALVLFSVQIPGDLCADLWKDDCIHQSWIEYCSSRAGHSGLCMVSGKTTAIAKIHPKNIRFPGDKAKLISSNDDKGFTYRGRFINDGQACEVGVEVTQKAHNALKWLIARQGYKSNERDFVVVAWAVSGEKIPNSFLDTYSLFQEEEIPVTYTAQEVGIALKKMINGYTAKLELADKIVVMGLDSAIPGRMAICFYRELVGSEFLGRILSWHNIDSGCVWWQFYDKEKKFIGTPAPKDIAEAVYGKCCDKKLQRVIFERLLPCIIDGLPIPYDLVKQAVFNASRRHSFEHPHKWEKTLGIACALYKCYYKEKEYSMTLERKRISKDYLYGRLLAVADRLESHALYDGEKKRPTNAARLMQRFADRPCSTWRTLEIALAPYKAKLCERANRYLKEIEEIMNLFVADDFIKDSPLSGEFLLGFHTQRSALWETADNKNIEDEI